MLDIPEDDESSKGKCLLITQRFGTGCSNFGNFSIR
jgi:hypothetical protein